MSWYRIIQIGELYGHQREKGERKDKYGAIKYYVPEMREYIIIPPGDIPRLRAYIRSAISPLEVLQKAAKKGFSLYFQGFKKGFTNEEHYVIINELFNPHLGGGNMTFIYCKQYEQRVDPVLCLARSIMYPKQLKPSPEYEIIKKKYAEARGRDKKRLRRELRKLDPIFDPYPYCRRCPIMKKLEKSCLGAQYDPEDEECQECKDKIKCCQLMRLRIESVLAGSREEVIREVLKDWQKLKEERKEKKKMARKKIQDVTEETIKEIQEGEEEKEEKKGRKRKKKESKEKKKETKSDKKGEKKKKKGKKTKEEKEIESLLKELDEAKEEGDQARARNIRKTLREEYDYYLSKSRS